MRKIGSIDSLFPKTRQMILAATYLSPKRWWYLSELASHLHLTPSSLQRELVSLVKSGILRQKKEGKQVYFKAEEDSPFYSDLRGLILKTVGLVDILQKALDPFLKQIQFAFVFGSVAKGDEHSKSDVDILIIGDVTLAQVSPAIRKAEEEIGRLINVAIYSYKDFSAKLKSEHHFIMNIMKSKKLFIFGEPIELARAFGK